MTAPSEFQNSMIHRKLVIGSVDIPVGLVSLLTQFIMGIFFGGRNLVAFFWALFLDIFISAIP